MAYVAKLDASARMKSRITEKRLCQRMTFVTACLLVPVVLARRLVRQLVSGAPARSGSVPVFAEARADASAIVPYIFMG